jgi:hypothetical protein
MGLGRTPSSGRTCASSNHCFQGNIHVLGDDSPVRMNRSDSVRSSPRLLNKVTRLHDEDVKVKVFRAMHTWKMGGGKRKDSPISDLVQEHGFGRNYPAELFKSVLKRGTTANQWHIQGRPPMWSSDVWAEMVEIIRNKRDLQTHAPAKVIRNVLMSHFNGESPSVRHITRKKREMKFRTVKLQLKPQLSVSMRCARLEFVKRVLMRGKKAVDWSRVVVIDEKWFTEQKFKVPKVEHRPGSPIKAPFVPHNKETRTQLEKLMYLAAVSSSGPIGIYELDWSKYFTTDKKGVKRKGRVDSQFLKPFWIKIRAAALKKLGAGPIVIWFDRTSCHTSAATRGFLEALGFTILTQSPRSPDFNMLDAFVFPALEKACDKAGAITKADIKKVVAKIWKLVTPAECTKAKKRVLLNMAESRDCEVNGVKLPGGNFYAEGKRARRS